MPRLDPVLAEFVAETTEHFDQVDQDLVFLESRPDDAEALARVFRAMHTLKGTSGFLAFERLEQIAHAAETLLADVRDGAGAVTTEMIDRLLVAADAVRRQLASVAETGAECADDVSALVASLETTATVTDAGIPEQRIGERAPEQTGDVPSDKAAVRVGVAQLDALMPILSDLVELRGELLSIANRSSDGELAQCVQRLGAATREAQEAVLRTRLQPIANLFNTIPRIARDVAAGLGKQVTVEMLGSDTELDRAVLEAVRDPLTHLVRNAVDHGIETPAEREAAGKPSTGVIRLRAYHDSGHVTVEMSDDGAGIDVGRLVQAAVGRNLVSAERAAAMPAAEALQLMFLPGCSTSEAVTTVSGRGVGMDVVRSNVQRIGGSVDVTTTLGAGSVFRLRLPLTLAVIQGVVVTLADRAFVVPQSTVLEIVPADDDSIGAVAGAHVHRWREQLLTVVDLAQVLALPAADTGDRRHLVVVTDDERTFALLVDDVLDGTDVVVKRLGPILEQRRLYGGATFVRDRELALILDVSGIADFAGMPRNQLPDSASQSQLAASSLTLDQFITLTVADRRLAVPLSLVDRLERISPERVEHAGAVPVVHHGGRIIRLAFCRELLGFPVDSAVERLHLVVVRRGVRHVGLVVDGIDDVSDETSARTDEIVAAGVIGAAVVGDSVAGLMDYRAAILSADPDFFAEADALVGAR